MEISKINWMVEAKKRFGDDTNNWKFKCHMCGRVQSYSSLKEEIGAGTFNPKRSFPIDENGMPDVTIYAECTSPDCNYVSYGLFSGPVTVIIDPKKPHDANLKKNCTIVFEFAEA